MGLVSLAWHFLTLCCVVTEGGGEPLQHEETKRRGVFHSHCETALLLDCCYVFSSFLAAISKISLCQKYSRQVSWYGESSRRNLQDPSRREGSGGTGFYLTLTLCGLSKSLHLAADYEEADWPTETVFRSCCERNTSTLQPPGPGPGPCSAHVSCFESSRPLASSSPACRV